MKSYKNTFPFPVGCPSYILPVREDNLLANVRFLKDRFDLVQLLYFGRDHLDEVMSPRVIDGLRAIREECGLAYTVHLPSDLGLLNPAPIDAALDVIERVMDATGPLAVEGYALHLDLFDACVKQPAPGAGHRGAFGTALAALAARLGERASQVYIENIGYDLALFGDLVLAGPFPVCMDAGHLVHYGHDPEGFMRTFGARVRQVHLHGVSGGRDHRPVTELEPWYMKRIVDFAREGQVPLIVEVYNEDDLAVSLGLMEGFLA
jgi:sugar phosphate isomerase/epimerase